MIIGIPKESWRDEHRVALTPAGVYSLVKDGQKVVVQAGAGSGCGFTNEAYEEAGAAVAFGANEVFGRADLVVKVMPPSKEEVQWVGHGKTLFSFFQFLVSNAEIIKRLAAEKCTAVGYSLIEDSRGDLPVLMTMSEIAGMLLPQIAGRFLETREGGRGILLGGIAGIPACSVVIIGAGMVGTTAAKMFAAAGADVMVMDNDLSRLRRLELITHKAVNTAIATPYNIDRYVRFADVLIGAVMIYGQQSPHVVTEAHIKGMRKGSVVLDVSIDQGGCIETSRPSTHSNPTYLVHDVIHYAVPNIPALVARTASHALNNVILPFVLQTAQQGDKAFAGNESLQRGTYLFEGECTHPDVGKLYGWSCTSIEDMMRKL